MIITIDTKKDTAQDIKKAINLLQEYITPETQPPEPMSEPGVMNIFSEDAKPDKDDDMDIQPMFY